MEVLSERCRKSLPPAAPESWFSHASVNLVFDFAMVFCKSAGGVGQFYAMFLNIAFWDCTTLPQIRLRDYAERPDPPSNNAIDFRTSRAICVFHFANLGMSRAIR